MYTHTHAHTRVNVDDRRYAHPCREQGQLLSTSRCVHSLRSWAPQIVRGTRACMNVAAESRANLFTESS